MKVTNYHYQNAIEMQIYLSKNIDKGMLSSRSSEVLKKSTK